MRRGAPALSVLAVMAAAAAIASAAPSEPPERLLITADEWDLTVSRTELDPGRAIIELYNRGEDSHDVRIKRRGSKRVIAIPETPPEELSRIETKLRRDSRYRLWCSLEGHRALGMEARIRTGPAAERSWMSDSGSSRAVAW